ncbi:MAG: hypothetical protein HC858_08540, partial [Brachymonas sp.]|nr:hypothetical protein [Brachymonas sp.]
MAENHGLLSLIHSTYFLIKPLPAMQKLLSTKTYQFGHTLVAPRPKMTARNRRTLLGISVFVVLIVWLTAIRLAVMQPWLGLALTSSASAPVIKIESIRKDSPANALADATALLDINLQDGSKLSLRSSDLIEEPDVFINYAQWDDFYTRQQMLHEALSRGSVTLAVLSAQNT